MKLTCDSCNAKYSIADDRVAGKVFKIRCKKCSHVIIVRGEMPAADVTPTTTTSGEGCGAWYAIVDGAQAGPFERARLADFAPDTFVWREGMDDWVARATLDEPRAPAPTPVDTRTLRNERNETSVLFTLGNLAQLASKPAPTAKPSATVGRPVEEGSGLIDIRALASSLATSAAAPAKPASGSFGDLPLYASTSIADPVVLMPAPSRRGIDRRLLVAVAAMLAMIAVLVTMLIVVVTRDSGTARAAVPEPAPAPAAVPVPIPVAIATPAPEPAIVVPQPATPPAPPKQTRKTPSPPPKTRLEAPPPKTDDGDCTDVSCAYNDYAGNCCDRFRPKTPKPGTPQPATGGLPENLDRAALAAGIATIKAQRCGGSSSARGDVNVSVKVTPEGKVSSVTIKSTPDQTLAACVEREAKLGSFAKTRRGGTFKYFWRF